MRPRRRNLIGKHRTLEGKPSSVWLTVSRTVSSPRAFYGGKKKKKKKEIFVQLVERCSKQPDSFKILSAIFPWKLSFEDPETSSYHYALIREIFSNIFLRNEFFLKIPDFNLDRIKLNPSWINNPQTLRHTILIREYWEYFSSKWIFFENSKF